MSPQVPVSSYLTFSPLLRHTSKRLFSALLLKPFSLLPVRKYVTLCCPDFPLLIKAAIERFANAKVSIKEKGNKYKGNKEKGERRKVISIKEKGNKTERKKKELIQRILLLKSFFAFRMN